MLNSGLHTPKSTGFFKSITATILRSLKALGKIELQLVRGNHFHSSGPCDLDLWPSDPKINRSPLLNKDIHRMKFEGSGWNRTPVIKQNRFSLFRPLWPWPLTPKSIGVLYLIRTSIVLSLKALGEIELLLWSGIGFHSSGPCVLDFWSTDPKINRFLLLNKGYHPMKCECSGSMGTRVIARKRFSLFGPLWPWPLTYWSQNQYGFSTH